MLSSKQKVLLLLCIGIVQAAFFCSDACGPINCNAQNENSCNACPANWVLGSSTCTLDPASGFQLVAKSQDMAGATSNLQMLPSSSLFSCGAYDYYGNYDCTTTLQISMSSGISIPHYAIQVIVWVIFYDDTTWTAANNFGLVLNSIAVTTNMAGFDGQKKYCGSGKQTYYNIITDFSHINSTNTPISINLKSDSSTLNCKWGFKEATILAKKCDSLCTECFGSSSTQCYSCIIGNYLSGNTCSSACLAGYGSISGSNLCIQCDSKCISCSLNSTNCASCQTAAPNQAFLYQTSCMNPCPGSTFPNSATHTCDSCLSLCLTCSNAITCSACQTGYYLFNNVCDLACPIGTYAPSGSYICNTCDPTCIACFLTATNCSSCTLTGSNKAYLLNSACLASCLQGTYPSTAPNLCNPCDLKCIACDTSSTNCSSCTLNGANIAYLYNMACLTNCPTGTFIATNPNVCSACDLKCITCDTSATHCQSCTLSGVNQAYLSNSACLATCPGGTYTSTNPNVCITCATQCSACTGPTNAQCSSCKTGNVLSGTVCDANCLTQYGPLTNSTCVYCSLNCITCYAVTDNCSSCTTSGTYESFLDSNVASYAKCVASCTTIGQFANSLDHKCDACDSNCLTCSVSTTHCQSCKTGDGWLNFVCYTTCPNSYFKDGANCTSCDTKCTICTASATDCSVCASSAYLLVNTCYNLCPDPYYNDNNGGAGPNLCLQCHSSCTSCTFAGNTNCKSCAVSYTLSGTTCDTVCLAGYGVSPITRECVACVSPCTGCSMSGTNCLSCISSPSQYYLITISGSTDCVSSCPTSFYLDSASLSCLQCPNTCSSCSSITNCDACLSPNLFFSNFCYNTCPDGSFQQNSTNCLACLPQCVDCVNFEGNCTSCQPNGTYKSYLLQNVCYTVCPGSNYGSNSDQKCHACNAVCMTCNGGGTGNCYTCNYPNLVKSGSTCSTACVAGYGITSNAYSCVKCNATCTQCSYVNANCTACQSTGNFSAFLYDDGLTYPKCLMICPDGTVSVNATRTCTSCATGCAICISTTTNCTSCLASYGLLNSTCYSPCPSQYYLSGGICLSCSPYCLFCSATNSTCSECVISGTYKSYLLNNSCLASCPIGYYKFDNSTLGPTTCDACNISCVACLGDTNNCSSCKIGYYLYNNSCLNPCPPGFFSYNLTQTCKDNSVFLTMTIGFSDTLNQKLVINLEFTSPLDHATFPLTTFQTINFSDPTLSLSIFHVSYTWTSSNSYQISLVPISYIYIYDVTVNVTTMVQPASVHYSSDGVPFSPTIYSQSISTNWFLIKGSGWSNVQASFMNTLSATSDLIQNFTTLPGVQQINKAGLTALIFPGAQLTSTSILINSVPAQNSYEGARFWGNFIYFEVPKWQKGSQQQKFVAASSADTLSQNARLLEERTTFEGNSLYWRFNRTGFTTFFIFDCYLQMLLIVLSWILIIVAKRLEKKIQQSKISRFYSIFHSLHEITIFYLSLGLVLELIYFEASSVTRIVSLALCLAFNIYFIIYQLYVYYELIKYPFLQLGSIQYREIVKKYGFYLKRIRFQQYDDIEKWSPKHLFRPYNYHIVSFYKKYLMVISVVLFYEYPAYAAGVLIALQIFQIVRFVLTWPFASKKRNIIRLILEGILLVFFLTVFLQVIYAYQIAQNNMSTIINATDAYYAVGWIGVACIFIFNISFFVIFIFNICCYCRKSNSEEIRQIRRDYYYQKVVSFEKCQAGHVGNEMLDSWVIKGDLNEQWIQDKQEIIPDVDVTVEKYVINKMGEGFTIQMEKIVQLDMKQPKSTVFKQKVKIREQINGTIGLTKEISSTFFKIIQDIFQEYDPNYQADFVTLKTIAKIQSSKYRSGDEIKLQDETHIQTLVLDYPGEEKKAHKLAVPLKGFPINPEILNPLIFSKTLQRKRLY